MWAHAQTLCKNKSQHNTVTLYLAVKTEEWKISMDVQTCNDFLYSCSFSFALILLLENDESIQWLGLLKSAYRKSFQVFIFFPKDTVNIYTVIN